MVLIEHRIYSYNNINSCTRILVVLSPAKTVLYCRGCESGRRTNYKAQATEYSLHIAIEPVRIKTSRGSSETRATEARARSLGRRQLLVLFYFSGGNFGRKLYLSGAPPMPGVVDMITASNNVL